MLTDRLNRRRKPRTARSNPLHAVRPVASDDDPGFQGLAFDLVRCDECGETFTGAACPECGQYASSTPTDALAFVTERPDGGLYLVVVELAPAPQMLSARPINAEQARMLARASTEHERPPLLDVSLESDTDACPSCWHSLGAAHATEGGVCIVCGCVAQWDGWHLDNEQRGGSAA